MKLKRMWIACAESKDDAFTANRAAMREYLLNHAHDVLELIEAAKRMRELQKGELPYDHQALSEAEAAFDATLQPFEADK